MPRMSESDVRLRLYMRLVAIDSANLTGDVTRVKKMAEGFLSAPALAVATKVQVDDERAKKVIAKTRAEVAATGTDSLIEYFDQPPPDRSVLVQFSLGEDEIALRCVLERAEMTKHRATALDELTAAFVRAADAWRGVAAVREGWIRFEYADRFPPYARLRKPRVSRYFPQRSLVTFLDRTCAGAADDVKALTEPAPAHAMITKHGDLIEVRWAKTLEDSEVAQASTWHDCWIRRIETEPDRDFNEHGDQLVNAGNAKPHAPLTLYNPWLKIGFKAVLYTPEGELEESAWEEALGVLKARALADGAEVEKIWIVVPLREDAVAAHDRVVAAGFEAAVYPGQSGKFWDPAPKGPWLSESTDVSGSVFS